MGTQETGFKAPTLGAKAVLTTVMKYKNKLLQNNIFEISKQERCDNPNKFQLKLKFHSNKTNE